MTSYALQEQNLFGVILSNAATLSYVTIKIVQEMQKKNKKLKTSVNDKFIKSAEEKKIKVEQHKENE